MICEQTVAQDLARADLLLLLASVVRHGDAGATLPDGASLELLARHADPGADALLFEMLEAFAAGRRAVGEEAWADERTRLFEGPVACPINETGYVRRDKGAIIADLCGFYRAFGFEPREGSGEKADHLAAELEFAAMLFVMIARARDAGRTDDLEIATDGLAKFLVDHLGDWLPLFRHRLLGTTNLPVFVRYGDLLAASWDACAAAVGAPSFTELIDAFEHEGDEPAMAETPYECGMAEDEAFVPLTGPSGPITPLPAPGVARSEA